MTTRTIQAVPDSQAHRERDDGRTGDGLVSVVDRLENEAKGRDDVKVRDIMDAFADRLFGPLLIVPALVAATPIGAIPLAPSLIGGFIILVASQRVFGRRHPWVPKALLMRSIEGERLTSGLSKSRPWARRIDRVIQPRLRVLLQGPMTRVIAGAAVVLAMMMPPLELVPFGVLAPALAVLVLGLALTVQDGLLALIGLLGAASLIGFVLYALL